MMNLHEGYLAELEFKLVTPWISSQTCYWLHYEAQQETVWKQHLFELSWEFYSPVNTV